VSQSHDVVYHITECHNLWRECNIREKCRIRTYHNIRREYDSDRWQWHD